MCDDASDPIAQQVGFVQGFEKFVQCWGSSVCPVARGGGDDSFDVSRAVGMFDQAPFPRAQFVRRARMFVMKNPKIFISCAMTSW